MDIPNREGYQKACGFCSAPMLPQVKRSNNRTDKVTRSITMKRTERTQVTRRNMLQLTSGVMISLLPTEKTEAAVRVADTNAGSVVITTDSGLRYYDFISPSEGEMVSKSSRVTIHYTLGTTGARNGWKIDSSYDRQPLSFTVGKGEVVKGLEEAVMGMRPGGKRRVLIPSTLGYKSKNDQPVPVGFAEYQRFKNIYLNPDRQYIPDVVMDVTLLKVKM